MGRIDAESETMITAFTWQGGTGFSSTENYAGNLTKNQTMAVAHALRGEGHDASEDGTGRGVPLVPFCMTSEQSPAHDLCPTLKKDPGGLGYHFNSGMAVRRLLPVECLRLQGFPDDYLDLPGAADGPKYRSIGNSMAVPVMRWIGERLI